MAGVDAVTGKTLDGFDHVQQSLGKIFSTPQGARVMREWFGNPGLRILAEPTSERTVLLWFNILYMLIELFEPRYRVRQFVVEDLTRIGFGDFTINGDFLPYAHLDWQQAAMFVSVNGNTVTLGQAR
jgi:phage baseplate assembly protein W